MRLPAEIFDIVLDYLHADISALRNAALTCRAWLPSCRFHLFRRIVLSNRQRLDQFCDVLRGNPLIAPYVSHLWLQAGYEDLHWLDDVSSRLPADLFHEIKALTLRIRSWSKMLCPPMQQMIYTQCTSVHTLLIDNTKFGDLDDFALLLDGLPMLRNLSMRGVTIGHHSMYSDNRRVDQISFPVLHRLRLELPAYSPWFLEWFMDKCDCSNLIELALLRMKTSDFPPAGLLLMRCSKTLQRLQLRWGPYVVDRTVAEIEADIKLFDERVRQAQLVSLRSVRLNWWSSDSWPLSFMPYLVNSHLEVIELGPGCAFIEREIASKIKLASDSAWELRLWACHTPTSEFERITTLFEGSAGRVQVTLVHSQSRGWAAQWL